MSDAHLVPVKVGLAFDHQELLEAEGAVNEHRAQRSARTVQEAQRPSRERRETCVGRRRDHAI